jgi:hypothetical protein
MGGMETSPARKKRRAKQLRAQEQRWASLAGPVEVRKIGDPAPASRSENVGAA